MTSDSRIVVDSDGTAGADEHGATDAFQAAIDDCASAGGGTVHVPSGEYVIGPVELRDDVTLHLDAGATVLASTDPADYGTEGYSLDALILANGARNVAITGRGVIDGRSDAFMETDSTIGLDIDDHDARQGDAYLEAAEEFPDAPVAPSDYRPDNLILFDDCERIALDGVTIRNSPSWTVHLLDCADVTVTGVTIDNDLRVPNNDGIVPDRSRDVRISDCVISTGDDGIVLKTTAAADDADHPCENVTVTNCTITSRSCAIIVGGETHYDIANCTFQNCVIRDSTRGLGVRLLDAGSIENVLFSDLVVETALHAGNWWGQGEPVYVLAVPRTADTDVGRVDTVRFSNVVATAEQGGVVFGSAESVVENVTFDGVDLRLTGGARSDAVGGNFDVRWLTESSPPSDPDLPNVYERHVPALYCRHVDGFALTDVTVTWDDASLPEFFSHAIECEQFEDVEIDGFEGRQAPGSTRRSAVRLHDGETITVRDSTAARGTDVFLELSETGDERLFVHNDVSRADQALVADDASFDVST